MQWTVPSFFLFAGIFVDSVYANKQCRVERSINGMALQGFVFKEFSVRAFHECDISCERELICQSYNYVVGEKSCELNNRTMEARPEHFLSDPARFYKRRLSNRALLGSIPELPAHSCQEIKASEGKGTISGKYWLDPTGNGTAVLVYCDMNLEDIDECATGNHNCDVNANCTNTVGGHNCTCKEGFVGDGRSCSEGHSCKHIRDSGRSKGDGEYLIDPEKNGNPLKVYCDMTNAGGGWLLILNIVIDDSLSQTLNSPETSYRKIDSYRNPNMIIASSAINELRSHVPFTQLRFHCNKQHGRTIHMATAANSSGEAVIQYFTGQNETMPASCGSFVRMKDDNSNLTQHCDRWGKNNDGHFFSGTWGHQGTNELYDHPAFVAYEFQWTTLPAQNRWECDDYSIQPSSGDFWRVFVR